MSPGFTLFMAGLSDTGLAREHNEDAIRWNPERGLALLADGMGGHNAGDVASQLCLDSLEAELSAEKTVPPASDSANDSHTPPGLLERAVRKAHETVCRAAHENQSYLGMGTTLVALWFYGKHVAVAHVGDSRAYRLHDGTLEQITADHSLVQELLDRGLMTAEQAVDSAYGHVVTQAIGGESAIEPGVQEMELNAGDIFLLCSDGLTDLVDDALIMDTLQAAAGNWERAAQHLIDLANRSGGTDNISVIVVAVGAPL